ncbi:MULTISPECIES: ABC transporter substrate-binding protein [unclassified Mesorhizobium]|jgi:branched-chain amino acid transport system substrate-binding protein|uniref:ABC transporter substrate-binding protein n=1 Tax=unclassified Mesorhizobium TaxID=325217 RepID=UPI000FCA5A66|nr:MULTISPECIES: ABC transporter substrate-binding protein [unclassified Mesorhizobium]RUU67498.1 ABC transporter substrate-binding protein [Mesorhizobium sp. M7A.T.Ca.TU.009.01.1.1]RUT87532.1 ABC transporter substrate-binding protein [Mesorhizobium sp. M7A.T.Ca.US.000.02.1.1]RUT91994.1 ABC transporter substrate-binding protein [Mesorhizobium sp. M7A.T.Ca.US.000.02.2.1]RUU05331.1 ABC transporter substrate-binding protein [Mesorhizobium sp. M7A.T.Ca.TU.009.02.1.1]RUV38585.1 ABC transporter subs
MKMHRRTLLALALASGLTAPSLALAADDTIKIGLLATFEGPFTVLGEDSERGAMTAVEEVAGTVAGKKIEIVKGSSDASPDSAVRAARKLVEQDGVKVLIGPLSGDEGLAVKDYAKTQPTVTFLNGASAAQDTTFRDPAPNFFRFGTDGAQWMAGLGTYAFKDKGYKNVATVAEDYSFPYTQVFGFMAEFCKAGGHVPSKSWVPIGNKDFSSVIAAIPENVDAIYVALGGADAVNFLTQYQQSGGAAPLIGGSITVDQTVLTAKGKLRDVLVGTPSAGPTADTNDTPSWTKFVEAYKKQPGAFPSPSLFAHAYYINMKAALLGLDKVGGDVSDGGAKLRETLSSLSFETPTGKVSLDKNRNAIADIFLTEVTENEDGTLLNKLIKVVPQVNQTLGIAEADFTALGAVSRDNPSCP